MPAGHGCVGTGTVRAFMGNHNAFHPAHTFPVIMVAFECDRCGKCCTSLGRHIAIERQLSDRDYFCRSILDNAVFPASVDREFREEIAEEFESGSGRGENKSCAFLCRNPRGEGTICAIYGSRPKVCRDFRCYRLIIRNRDGIACGKVIGKNTIRTDDAALMKLWSDRVAAVPAGDTGSWLKTVSGLLEDHGYRADPVL